MVNKPVAQSQKKSK